MVVTDTFSYYLVVVLTGIGITNPRTQSIINGCLTLWNMCKFPASVLSKELSCSC